MTQAAKKPGKPTASTQMNVDSFISAIMQDLKKNQLELPMLPQLAIKINQTVENKTSTAKSIAQVIGTDPALSAKLIQIANSPLVRSTKKIENVQMAVTRMGADTVRNIVTSFMIKQMFRSKNKLLQTMLLEIWSHSAHVAAISHVLASRFTDITPDEAMLAGLLHDIGKLPILGKAKNMTNLENNTAALELVLEKLHQPLGRAILESWNFSKDFTTAVFEHENWQRNSTELDHTDIVIVANILSHIGKPSAKNIDFLQVPALGKLSLDPESCITVLKEANEDILAIQRIFTS